MSNELDHQAFLYRRSGTVHFQLWFTCAARGPGARFLPFPAKKHKTQCQSYSIWFPRKLPKKSRRLPREDYYRRHRVPARQGRFPDSVDESRCILTLPVNTTPCLVSRASTNACPTFRSSCSDSFSACVPAHSINQQMIASCESSLVA